VAVSTVATLVEGGEHPRCPDDAFGCVETGGPAGPIRIATLLPLTGARDAAGMEAHRAVRLAVAHRGSLLGHDVQLVSRDDGCSPDRIAVVARRLALDTPDLPPIAAAIGAPCPGVTEPAAQILSDSGIPLVSWSRAEVSFIDPPPERSFYVPIDPPGGDSAFLQDYEESYGSAPESPWAYRAYRATELLLDAMEAVAIRAGEGEVLLPRIRLRDELRALGRVLASPEPVP
jgi:ABC-type branched-subunit amino acid transport system substrate-binding protein